MMRQRHSDASDLDYTGLRRKNTTSANQPGDEPQFILLPQQSHRPLLAFAHRAWVAILWFALGLLTGIFWWPKL